MAIGPSTSTPASPRPSARAGLRLRLDLEKVTFLSSAGIGVLVKFHKRLAAVKGSLVIARLSAPVKTVLEMTRLTALLVATGEGGGEVTLTVGSTLSRHGLLCEVFDLNPSARMALTSIGGAHPVGSAGGPAGRALDVAVPSVDDRHRDWRVRSGR